MFCHYRYYLEIFTKNDSLFYRPRMKNNQYALKTAGILPSSFVSVSSTALHSVVAGGRNFFAVEPLVLRGPAQHPCCVGRSCPSCIFYFYFFALLFPRVFKSLSCVCRRDAHISHLRCWGIYRCCY